MIYIAVQLITIFSAGPREGTEVVQEVLAEQKNGPSKYMDQVKKMGWVKKIAWVKKMGWVKKWAEWKMGGVEDGPSEKISCW